MKKILLSFILMLGLQAGYAQQYDYLDALVIDSAWNGIPGYNVWINVYHNGNLIVSKHGLTSQWAYRDSIPSSMSRDSVKFIVYDCNGDLVKGSWGTKPPPHSMYYSDTFYIDTNCMMLEPSCQAGFMTHQGGTPLTIDFTDTTKSSGINFAKPGHHMYFFGDNDSIWGVSNPSHTYAHPGKYYVLRTYSEIDSIHGHYLCSSSWGDTVVVPQTALTCQASYYVDTVNSGSNTAIIYNNSTPLYNDTNYTVSYLWNFGDGDTSSHAFPTHAYDSTGSYAVCLTISVDSAGYICTSTFCDTLGIDSTGSLIYKNTLSGFVLEVQDPNSIGLDENPFSSFEVYPNPVNGELFVKPSAEVKDVLHYRLYDIKGTALQQGQWSDVSSGTTMSLDLTDLPKGIYFLKLGEGSITTGQFKILKQ